MTVTTYSTDADIETWDSAAVELLPPGDSATFDRLRKNAYDEIGRRLARREPPTSQSVLGIVPELQHAEVLFTLHRLYAEAAAKVGGDSVFDQRCKDYLKAFADELDAVRISASGWTRNADGLLVPDGSASSTLQSVMTVPIWRR